MEKREKAPADGVYLFNGGRFRVKKGGVMPPGATFEDGGKTDDRAKTAATDTEAARGPAENQAKAAKPATE